ncbi:transcription factor FapR [Zhaonella formicivorans]|jgi:acyl-coenzyme A thioesterase PaaI-like protein|uniref:transcription factor FapR n=1 Tax=Zhaonella formicivorans TaxID=2528593 RepID=UPI0010F2E597|nr:transcription factor FapR [Zhaonella formicivorans]
MRPSNGKKERQQRLADYLKTKPFATDEELAERFQVSVQTIRLDRLALGIPQVRERVKTVAQEAYNPLRSLTQTELVGDLIDVRLGESGISILDITDAMVLEHVQIARGHYLFAQANTLAVAVIDADVVLTGSARVRYKRPVFFGERVVAKATVQVKRSNKFLVSVVSTVEDEVVFKGQFIVTALTPKKEAGS